MDASAVMNIDEFAVCLFHYRVNPGKLLVVRDRLNQYITSTLDEQYRLRGHLDFGDYKCCLSHSHFYCGNWGDFDLTLVLRTWMTGIEVRLLHQLANIEGVSHAQASLHAAPVFDCKDNKPLRPIRNLFPTSHTEESPEAALSKHPFSIITRIKLDPFALISYGLLFYNNFLDTLLSMDYKSILGKGSDNIRIYPMYSLGWNDITFVIMGEDLRVCEKAVQVLRHINIGQIILSQSKGSKIDPDSPDDSWYQPEKLSWFLEALPEWSARRDSDTNKKKIICNWLNKNESCVRSYSLMGFDFSTLVKDVDSILRKLQTVGSCLNLNSIDYYDKYKAIEMLIGNMLENPTSIDEERELPGAVKEVVKELVRHITLITRDAEIKALSESSTEILLKVAAKPGHEKAIICSLKRLKLLSYSKPNESTLLGRTKVNASNNNDDDSDRNYVHKYSQPGAYDLIIHLPGDRWNMASLAKLVWVLHYILAREYLLPRVSVPDMEEKGYTMHAVKQDDQYNEASCKVGVDYIRISTDIRLSISNKCSNKSNVVNKKDQLCYYDSLYGHQRFQIHRRIWKCAIKLLDQERQYALRTAYANIISIFNERITNPLYYEEYLEYVPILMTITSAIIKIKKEASITGKRPTLLYDRIAEALEAMEKGMAARYTSSYDLAGQGDPNPYLRGGINMVVSSVQNVLDTILQEYNPLRGVYRGDVGLVVLNPYQTLQTNTGLGAILRINSEYAFQWGRSNQFYHELAHQIMQITELYGRIEDTKALDIEDGQIGEMAKVILPLINSEAWKEAAARSIKRKHSKNNTVGMNNFLEDLLNEVVAEVFNYGALFSVNDDKYEDGIVLWAKHFWYLRLGLYELEDRNPNRQNGYKNYCTEALTLYYVCILVIYEAKYGGVIERVGKLPFKAWLKEIKKGIRKPREYADRMLAKYIEYICPDDESITKNTLKRLKQLTQDIQSSSTLLAQKKGTRQALYEDGRKDATVHKPDDLYCALLSSYIIVKTSARKQNQDNNLNTSLMEYLKIVQEMNHRTYDIEALKTMVSEMANGMIKLREVHDTDDVKSRHKTLSYMNQAILSLLIAEDVERVMFKGNDISQLTWYGYYMLHTSFARAVLGKDRENKRHEVLYDVSRNYHEEGNEEAARDMNVEPLPVMQRILQARLTGLFHLYGCSLIQKQRIVDRIKAFHVEMCDTLKEYPCSEEESRADLYSDTPCS